MMDDAIDNLIQEIRCFQLNESNQDGNEFVLIPKDAARFWPKVFIKHFLFDYHGSKTRLGDDLLFFVRKQITRRSVIGRLTPSAQLFTTKIDVYRASSKQLPLKELDVDWEETLHLNLIMQKFEYTLVVAVCTQTAAEQIEILNKKSVQVFPSPSKRSMDSKGEQEKITYPEIYFSIDNYDELCKQIEVHDGEFLFIELLYKSVSNKEMIPLFQCHLNYSTLSQIAYLNINPDQSRSKWFVSLNIQSLSNLFYFRASGSQKCGLAEIAMSQIDNESQITLPSGRTTSTLSLNDFEWDTSIKTLKYDKPQAEHDVSSEGCCAFCPKCTGRRMSEPSMALSELIDGWKQRRLRKSKSETQSKTIHSREIVETKDIKDELEHDSNKHLWSSPGYTHVFFDQKRLRKNTNPSFQCFPTYITLDWSLIAKELINPSKRSYLVF